MVSIQYWKGGINKEQYRHLKQTKKSEFKYLKDSTASCLTALAKLSNDNDNDNTLAKQYSFFRSNGIGINNPESLKKTHTKEHKH
jgi:hypothetical protein